MENKIYNSLYTKIFVSPFVYNLIIYIYIYLVIWSQPFTKKFCLELDSNPCTVSTSYGAITDQATQYSNSIQYFLFIYEYIYSF